MLILQGTPLKIRTQQRTDRSTGVIDTSYVVDILHEQAGKSAVDFIKIDGSIIPQWESSIGHEIQVEVKLYSVKTEDGTISGFSLVDKKSLPNILRKPAKAQA